MTRYDGIDLPEHAFGDDETGGGETPRLVRKQTGIFGWLIGLGLLIVVIVLTALRRF